MKFRAQAVLVWHLEAETPELASKAFDDQLNMVEMDSGDEYQGYRDTEIEELPARLQEKS